MYGVPDYLNIRALTHSDSKTGLRNERANDLLRLGRESLQGRRGACTLYGKIWSTIILLYFTMPPRSF